MHKFSSRRMRPQQVAQGDTIQSVSISMANEFYVGDYTKVYLELVGIAMEDLTFQLPQGSKAGVISPCRDAEYNPRIPEIMVCFGHTPGVYELEIVKSDTNEIIASHTFVLTTNWMEPRVGPGLSFAGAPPVANGGHEPQPRPDEDLGVHDAKGTRNIAIAMVDFTDGRYPTNMAALQAIKDRWMDEIINGVVSRGRIVSTRTYFRELSGSRWLGGSNFEQQFDISAQIFGPYHLNNPWASYFNPSTDPKKTGRLLDPPSIVQDTVTMSDPDIGFKNIHTLLILSQTNSVGQNAWPSANHGVFTSTEGAIHLSYISMPQEWGQNFNSDRYVHATVAHELCHNLGLGDQYRPEVPGRNIGSWDLMDTENDLPHLSLFHLMLLGWRRPIMFGTTDLKTLPKTIKLAPIEERPFFNGSWPGIRIRDSQGRKYYVEYRSARSSQIGDQFLGKKDAVLVTEVDSRATISRPQILLAPDDADGDGSVLTNGLDFEDSVTPPAPWPSGLEWRVSVSGIDGTKADVTVGSASSSLLSLPELFIHPSTPGRHAPFRNPDIEIRNAKSAIDNRWLNKPWPGYENSIIAKISNNGDVDATEVTVDFSVGSTSTVVGTDIQNVPAHGVVEFQSNWTPPPNLGATWLAVSIRQYSVPSINQPFLGPHASGPTVISGYAPAITCTLGNPAFRESTTIEVSNPYDLPTQIWIEPGQTNPLYRLYVEHTTLYLLSHETRRVKIMHEYDPSNMLQCSIPLGTGRGTSYPASPSASYREQEVTKSRILAITDEHARKANKCTFRIFAMDPRDPRLDRPCGTQLLRQIQWEVCAADRVKFEFLYQDDRDYGNKSAQGNGILRLFGRVVVDSTSSRIENAQGVTGGKVIHTITSPTEGVGDSPETVYLPAVSVDLDGRFSAEQGLGSKSDQGIMKQIKKNAYVEAHYLSLEGYGECCSQKVSIHL